ncbi:GntR family transcriptional regulator [Streptomyces albireticuli]|uniref:HTH gntR-type domain-containing protein n=1 Tax=Streptomyces albireticuli TaxID=1940 RepID=A0A2A2D1J8_9ACTN|nr:GntR family transcriptional regulator [Streptomyces albireticuli]MCD9145890.1 GntR family transcriptional regulator [Streptomyces albireticuli]MCD9166104.1 GntR family transcriptional regulator [Streptomyces albireticuli]MCD9196384.1 GntR family transcriptional regulator [Streptomyces albireticuli]PAU45289.1 hypothetical protein CK936_30210 [Streptomyces albireticuli]
MTTKPAKWRALADRLAAEIDDGTYPQGSRLPRVEDLVRQGEGSTATVQRAYRELEAEGYVITRRRGGTVVRDRSIVRVPLSRYSSVLTPGGDRGPWETATAAQGLDGKMVVPEPAAEEIAAPDDVAQALGLGAGARVIRRRRLATIGEEVVQVQEAYYPTTFATAAGLDVPGKVVGGVLGAMTGAGFDPTEVDERVTAGVPTAAQAAELSIGTRVPVLVVQRVTRDNAGRPLELLRIVGAADRLELVYDGLPLKRPTGDAA